MSEHPYYISAEVRRQLQKSKDNVLKHDTDRIFVIDGREGTGKSTLALQLAYFFDETLCLDDVVFTAEDFAKRVRTVEPHKAIVFDEAFNGLSSKGALSKANKELVRLLQECRQRNLFIFIVLPSIFLLEKYVAIFRSHALIHTIVASKDITRRYYKIYNYSNKKLLYIKGKERMSYWFPKIAYGHRFYGKFPPTIDDKAYRKKKMDAFRVSDTTNKLSFTDKQDEKFMIKYHKLLILARKALKLSYGRMEKWCNEGGLPVSKTNLHAIERKYSENQPFQSSVYNNINVLETNKNLPPKVEEEPEDVELNELIEEEFSDEELPKPN